MASAVADVYRSSRVQLVLGAAECDRSGLGRVDRGRCIQLRNALKNGSYAVKLKSLAALMNVTALVNISIISISTQDISSPTAAPSMQSYSTGRPSKITYVSSVKNGWLVPITVAIGGLIFVFVYYTLLRFYEKYFCRQEQGPQTLENAYFCKMDT